MNSLLILSAVLAIFASPAFAIENFYKLVDRPQIDGVKRGQEVSLFIERTPAGVKKNVNYPLERLEIVGILDISGKMLKPTVAFDTKNVNFDKLDSGVMTAEIPSDLPKNTRKIKFCIRDNNPTTRQKIGLSWTSDIKGCTENFYHVSAGDYDAAD